MRQRSFRSASFTRAGNRRTAANNPGLLRIIIAFILITVAFIVPWFIPPALSLLAFIFAFGGAFLGGILLSSNAGGTTSTQSIQDSNNLQQLSSIERTRYYRKPMN